MSDASLHTLDIVLEREQRARDAVVTSLRQADQRVEQILAQGAALRDYRRETSSRWAMPIQEAASARQLRTAHDYLARLDEAIDQQQQTQQRARMACDQLRAELLQVEMRIAALGKLIDQRRRAQAARQQRADQKASDESARQLLAHAGSHSSATSAMADTSGSS